MVTNQKNLAKKNMTLGAAEMVATTGTPTESVQGNMDSWALDPAATERVAGVKAMPDNWNGTSGFVCKLSWQASDTESNDVRLRAEVKAMADGESIFGGATETFDVTAATGGTTNLHITNMGTFSSGDFAAGDWLRFSAVRLGGDGADSYTQDIYFFGMELEYTAG